MIELTKEILIKTLKSIGRAVIITDQDNQLLLMNSLAGELFGVKESEMLGKNILLEIEDHVFATKWIEFLIRDVDVFYQDMEISYPAYKMLSAAHSKIKDENGQHIGSITIFRDISGEKEVETRLKDFVAEVSHEFRSALASINGFIGAIKRCPEMPLEERDNCLKMIEGESHRINVLVEHLLELSKLETLPAPLKLIINPMDELVNNSVYVLKPQFDQKQISLETKIETADYNIMIDKDMIIGMIHNLLINSLKYTPEYGKVLVSLMRRNDFIIFQVIDTGYGISKKDLPYIFDKFYRVNRGETVAEGSGLGLAIVKDIVNLHKGTIEIQSEEGRGTTVTISIPVQKI